MKFCSLLLTLVLLTGGCASLRNPSKAVGELPATALKPYGRALYSNAALELIGSAVHFGFSFEGRECRITVSLPQGSSHNYLQYELDGVYQKRIRVSGKEDTVLVLTAPSVGKHTLWVYKATEAHTGPLFIRSVAGKNIRPLARKAAPLIEFIGNSITCGAAADLSEVPCGTGPYHDQHNAYQAYGPRVARALQANFLVSAVSGIGIYRNWNSEGPGMPLVYEKADFQLNATRPWVFSSYTPQVVSIALGTNDFSNGDGKKERLPFDSTAFVTNYTRFVGLVRSKYPTAQIALLSSPMVKGRNRVLLQNCLQAVKEHADQSHPWGKPVALFFFREMNARGCTGHPSVEDHALLAEELLPFFKQLLQ